MDYTLNHAHNLGKSLKVEMPYWLNKYTQTSVK